MQLLTERDKFFSFFIQISFPALFLDFKVFFHFLKVLSHLLLVVRRLACLRLILLPISLQLLLLCVYFSFEFHALHFAFPNRSLSFAKLLFPECEAGGALIGFCHFPLQSACLLRERGLLLI